MFITSMFFYILVGLVLGARAITLAELEQRVSTVEQQLEYGGKKHQPLHYLNSKYCSYVVTVEAVVVL